LSRTRASVGTLTAAWLALGLMGLAGCGKKAGPEQAEQPGPGSVASSRNGAAAKNEPAKSGSGAPAADKPAPQVGKPVEPTPGQLKPVGGGVLESPAGLRYAPGSREGHRTRHVLRHARDNPDRPGPHGVFTPAPGSRAAASDQAVFALIDDAYRRAQRGGRGVQTRRQQGRTIHTVDMGRTVGYVGGRDGNRQNRPPARHIRLVLEGRNVITAFPLRR